MRGLKDAIENDMLEEEKGIKKGMLMNLCPIFFRWTHFPCSFLLGISHQCAFFHLLPHHK